MPVRKIPKNYLSVTGTFSSEKNGKSLGYESLLEQDLMILLEFDDEVEGFEEQPVKVPVIAFGKRPQIYIPDILIRYRPSILGGPPRNVLGEVKVTNDLKKNQAKYANKFEAAHQFSYEHGWKFRIFTEVDIRTPLLSNLKFLREFHYAQPDAHLISLILNSLGQSKRPVTINSLIKKICQTDIDVLFVAPAIWHLLATKKVQANLKQPLTLETPLTLSDGVHLA